MLQTTTRIKLLLAYREQEFTAAVFTLQDPIGGQTRNLSCDGATSRDDSASAPRLIVGLLCYWGLLEGRPLWESVQLRIRTGHRQASNDALALPKRDRKAALCLRGPVYQSLIYDTSPNFQHRSAAQRRSCSDILRNSKMAAPRHDELEDAWSAHALGLARHGRRPLAILARYG
jgi:hypothetical protein